MQMIAHSKNTNQLLRVCSYEDRPAAMDGLILMGESLCRLDAKVSLHLTVPNAPTAIQNWAERTSGVVLSTNSPDGVNGWDVKSLLLLQELDAGWQSALWLDADMIITRPISELLEEFPPDCLVVTEEWNRQKPVVVTDLWQLQFSRPVRPVNSCALRVTQIHRPLLARWLQMTNDLRYREAQELPFEQRPWHLASDQPLLTALLESTEFGHVRFDYLRLGRHIVQCAGSSGYRPHDRVLDLFRGLPPLIHCIGRKPWMLCQNRGRIGRLLISLADDVSPYVLASRSVARNLNMTPQWIEARTCLGALLRMLSAYHPAMAGFPLAVVHAFHMSFCHLVGFGKRKQKREFAGTEAASCS
jgi:hypothetical protein